MSKDSKPVNFAEASKQVRDLARQGAFSQEPRSKIGACKLDEIKVTENTQLWSDKEWIKYVTNKNLETHVLKKGEDLIGYYEQEYHPGSNEVELINMGVLKEFRGFKLGSTLVNHAIASASRKNPGRMWVHTCSLDHKHALQNYKSKGFEIFKEEEIDFVA